MRIPRTAASTSTGKAALPPGVAPGGVPLASRALVARAAAGA